MPRKPGVPADKSCGVTKFKWRRLSVAIVGIVATFFQLHGYFVRETAPLLKIFVDQRKRNLDPTSVPVAGSILINIRVGDLSQTMFQAELKTQTGLLVTTATAFRRDDIIEVQLPPIEKPGDYYLQIFDGADQILEAPLTIEGELQQSDFSRLTKLLIELWAKKSSR